MVRLSSYDIVAALNSVQVRHGYQNDRLILTILMQLLEFTSEACVVRYTK